MEWPAVFDQNFNSGNKIVGRTQGGTSAVNPAGGWGWVPPMSVGAPDRQRKMFQGSPLTWHLLLPEKAWD